MEPIRVILGAMTFGKQVDEKTAGRMVNQFLDQGYTEIDTAHRYLEGKSEEILGHVLTPSLREKVYLATKVHPGSEAGLRPEQVVRQVETSLKRLQTDWIDLVYLHRPDDRTPIEMTLEACQKLFRQGKFRELGLSNYAAWQVADIWHICRRNGWVLPTAYQGRYNAIARAVESELFPSLRNFGIRFYAYNPLAGGLLTGKYADIQKIPEDGRFGLRKEYRNRYWKACYFDAIEEIRNPCRLHSTPMAEAALRWLNHHSLMRGARNDGIVLGVTTMEHLTSNLHACKDTVLPEAIVEAYDRAWKIARLDCPEYFP
jgi:aflatoxin B1 aldehyde reductase